MEVHSRIFLYLGQVQLKDRHKNQANRDQILSASLRMKAKLTDVA